MNEPIQGVGNGAFKGHFIGTDWAFGGTESERGTVTLITPNGKHIYIGECIGGVVHSPSQAVLRRATQALQTGLQHARTNRTVTTSFTRSNY